MTIAVYFEELVHSLNVGVTRFNTLGARMKLYKNNLDPDSETEITDFTEADFGGYAYQALASWPTSSATYDAPRAVTVHPYVTFTANGTGSTQLVYGYYVTDSSGNLLFSEKFTDGAKTMNVYNGQTLAIQAKYSRRSEYHSGA